MFYYPSPLELLNEKTSRNGTGTTQGAFRTLFFMGGKGGVILLIYEKIQYNQCLIREIGGERGIRTLDTVARILI